jgi:hypothetical protein
MCKQIANAYADILYPPRSAVYAHYAEQIGKVSEGCGGDGTAS